MTYPLLMEPVFSPRPWGGRRLRERFGKAVPDAGGPYGESWELSDHPDGRSRVANGPWAGELFGELVRRHPRELCGVARAPERFPLLVKYIDAAEDLSLQVHPDDARAPEGDRGKTECWLVMDCAPGAQIIYGLRPGTGGAALRQASLAGDVEPCVRRLPIAPGDFLDVPAGTVHAILAGTLICEVQQSSNTTYRLWDWNRQPPRELHVDAGCDVIDEDPAALAIVHADQLPQGAWRRMVKNAFFEVQSLALAPATDGRLDLPNDHGLIINVVAGGGRWSLARAGAGNVTQSEAELRAGQTWFIPAGLEPLALRAGAGGMRLLASRSLEF